MNSASSREIPRFMLYGESPGIPLAESVHIESIEARSRVHDWHIDRHTHAGLFQLLFLMKGQVRAEIDADLVERAGPCVIAIHPSVVHGFVFSEEAQGFVLTLDQNLVFSGGSGNATFAPLFVSARVLDLGAAPELRKRLVQLLVQLVAESNGVQAGHTLMLESLARCVMLLLVRLHDEQRSADQSGRSDFELFSRLRALIELRYKEQWQVGAYAAALGVTPVRISRLCNRLAGCSAFDIAQKRLMLEACRKLTYVPSSIATIAYELGFQDPAYFSRLFKRHTGMTPKAFRERSRGERA